MKKLIFTVLAIVAISYATEPDPNTEVCNSGAFEVQAPVGSCTNEGYVCYAATDQQGGISFFLADDASCSNIRITKFVTYDVKSGNVLDKSHPKTDLRLYFMEDPLENVGALAVATNTAFIINAQNEKFKVCVIYHRAEEAQTDDGYNVLSVRLQSIGKCSI